MDDATDMDLLRQYAGRNSETAFAALVARHLNLVYSAALRKTGNHAAAEEITQAVFVILAQKAGRIPDKTILPGWLYQAARLTASSFLKSEARRARREQEAYMQTETVTAPPDETWTQLAPLLDDAMGQLDEKERAAVVLRFFNGQSFADMAKTCGVSENAAQKRVSHALEKLHRYFSRRGVSSTTPLLAGAISAHSVHAAPVMLAKSITAMAITKGATAGGSTLILIKGTLKIMAWTKSKVAIVAGLSVLILAEATHITINEIQTPNTEWWEVKNGPFQWKEVLRKPPVVKILPTKFYEGGWSITGKGPDAVFVGIRATLPQIVQTAYQIEGRDKIQWRERVVYPADLPMPEGRWDFIADLPHGSVAALQEEIKSKFGLVGKFEPVETNVLLLKVKSPNAPGIKPVAASGGTVEYRTGNVSVYGGTVSDLARYLEENAFNMPVIDQTGLKGNFAFDLRWNEKGGPDALKQALVEQLGLELVPGVEPVEMLVVEKVK